MSSRKRCSSTADRLIHIGDTMKASGEDLPPEMLNDIENVLQSEPFSKFLAHERQVGGYSSPAQSQHATEIVAPQSNVTSGWPVVPEKLKNIFLIGITGTGKSAVGNLLCFPETPFLTSNSAHSVTKEPKTHVSMTNGFQVTDTMGFFDTELSMDEAKQHAISVINQAREGVDAVLFVAKCGRLTSIEYDVLKVVVDMIFGAAVCANLIVVLTHVPSQQLVKSRVNQNGWLQEQLRAGSSKFNELYKICSGRVVFVENPPEDDDAELEAANKKLRHVSRQNLIDAVNSITSQRYMPELARDAQTRYLEGLRKIEEEMTRAKTESERQLKAAAIVEYQRTFEKEVNEKLDESFEREQEVITRLKNQIRQQQMDRQIVAKNDALKTEFGWLVVKTLKGLLDKEGSCSVL